MSSSGNNPISSAPLLPQVNKHEPIAEHDAEKQKPEPEENAPQRPGRGSPLSTEFSRSQSCNLPLSPATEAKKAPSGQEEVSYILIYLNEPEQTPKPQTRKICRLKRQRNFFK
jgi:hypothetical protein